ncbi:MAG: ABC transporter ATP-binding protein [Oscillospiraceae bacterium]|nr:ABC transporter ATP-binding protein [Oscillospiraceae bacterium]
MTFFSANGITAGYGRQNVIENISFQLAEGCLMGIIGANGSGKTTLLKALCGILPHRGSCTLDSVVLERLSSRKIAAAVSYIPQRSGISIDISALDVVLMGFNPQLGLLEYPTQKMKQAAAAALAQVGLAGKEEMNYLQLSEGQKQLCVLARTLVSDSKLLLLDEPESALDFRFRYQMLKLLRQWASKPGRSAIVTLHDPALALNYCDQLLLLSDGGILGIIEPKTDPLDKMEHMLSQIYGCVSLRRCINRGGQPCLVMVKEEEQ